MSDVASQHHHKGHFQRITARASYAEHANIDRTSR